MKLRVTGTYLGWCPLFGNNPPIVEDFKEQEIEETLPFAQPAACLAVSIFHLIKKYFKMHMLMHDDKKLKS